MSGAAKGGEDQQIDDPELDKKCCQAYQNFVHKEHAGSSTLSGPAKKLGKSTTIRKIITGPMGESDEVVNCCQSSVAPKFYKGAKQVSDEDFVNNVLIGLAIQTKERKLKTKAKGTPEEMVKCWKTAIAASLDEKEKKTQNAAVVDRLTNTKGYTGSHKERFDECGKGKGKEGRETTADKSGYVGGYKGQGTYGTKK